MEMSDQLHVLAAVSRCKSPLWPLDRRLGGPQRLLRSCFLSRSTIHVVFEIGSLLPSLLSVQSHHLRFCMFSSLLQSNKILLREELFPLAGRAHHVSTLYGLCTCADSVTVQLQTPQGLAALALIQYQQTQILLSSVYNLLAGNACSCSAVQLFYTPHICHHRVVFIQSESFISLPSFHNLRRVSSRVTPHLTCVLLPPSLQDTQNCAWCILRDLTHCKPMFTVNTLTKVT
jgi:hypothetical protein